MGAVVQRVVTFPFPKTEYLSLNRGAKSEWSEKRRDAEVFATYAEADACAIALRPLFAGFHSFVHAAICEKPIPHKPVIDPLAPAPVRKGYVPRKIRDLEEASRANGSNGNSGPVIKMDPRRLGEIRRDPVEAD